MQLDKFLEDVFDARVTLEVPPENIKVLIQGGSNFTVLPFEDEDGKSINIIRLD